MNRILKLFLSFLLINIAHAETAQIVKDSFPMSAVQQRNLNITTVAVQASQNLQGPIYPAEVIVPANQIRLITSPYAGLITQVLVNAGQAVKKGQALATISSMDLMGLQREYMQSSAQTKLSAQTLSRDELLFKEGIIAEKRLQESQSKHAEMLAKQAEYQQLFSASGITSKNKNAVYQSRFTINAPHAGVVGNLVVSQGQRIDAMTPLMNVAQLQPLWLDIQVPLLDIKNQVIQKGVSVELQDFNTKGVVIALLPNLNVQTQAATVRAQINNPAGLFPSQIVDVRIQSNSKQNHNTDTLNISSKAIVQHQGKTIVFVKTNTGFKVMPVKVTNLQGDIAQVKAAFTVQDRVAVSGTATLKAQLLGLSGEEE